MPTIDNYVNEFSFTDFLVLVNRNLTSIIITRADETILPAQNVRIVTFSDRENPWRSEGARTGRSDAIILGYKGSSVFSDTDIEFGDRFTHDGQMYDVFEIIPSLGFQFQAMCQLRS